MSQNGICLFPNNITLSIHARSPLFSGSQTGLCCSPAHLPSLAFFWAPEFSFLNAALSLSFTLLILDPFYFVLSGLLWIPVLSLKVLLRPLQPHAVGNLSEAKIYHLHSIPLPTSPVTLPGKEIHLVWHSLLFPNPHWLFSFPLCSQSHWLSTIQLSIFHGVELPLAALSLSMWAVSFFLKPGTVLFPLVSESHIPKLIPIWLFGSIPAGIARSAGNTQGVHGQSCR